MLCQDIRFALGKVAESEILTPYLVRQKKTLGEPGIEPPGNGSLNGINIYVMGTHTSDRTKTNSKT